MTDQQDAGRARRAARSGTAGLRRGGAWPHRGRWSRPVMVGDRSAPRPGQSGRLGRPGWPRDSGCSGQPADPAGPLLAPAGHLEAGQGGGGGHVERLDGPEQRDADGQVAALPDQPAQARPSPPSTRAIGSVGDRQVPERLRRRTRARPTTRPAAASAARAAGMPGTAATGRYSAAPAAAFSAAGVRPAARWRRVTRPVAPADTALRMTAPRLCGSVTPSSTTRNGAVPSGAGPPGCRGRLRERVGPGHHALRGVGEGQGVQLGPLHPADGHPAAPGQLQDLAPATRTDRCPRRPSGGAPGAVRARKSSRTAWRPSTCSPPSRTRRPAGQRPVPGWPGGLGRTARIERSPAASRRRAHLGISRATAKQATPSPTAEGPERLGPLGLDAHRRADDLESAAAPCPAGRGPAWGPRSRRSRRRCRSPSRRTRLAPPGPAGSVLSTPA